MAIENNGLTTVIEQQDQTSINCESKNYLFFNTTNAHYTLNDSMCMCMI